MRPYQIAATEKEILWKIKAHTMLKNGTQLFGIQQVQAKTLTSF